MLRGRLVSKVFQEILDFKDLQAIKVPQDSLVNLVIQVLRVSKALKDRREDKETQEDQATADQMGLQVLLEFLDFKGLSDNKDSQVRMEQLVTQDQLVRMEGLDSLVQAEIQDHQVSMVHQDLKEALAVMEIQDKLELKDLMVFQGVLVQ